MPKNTKPGASHKHSLTVFVTDQSISTPPINAQPIALILFVNNLTTSILFVYYPS